MDRRHVIWIVLLSVITEMPAAGLVDICASCHTNATCEDKLDNSGKICICLYGFVGNGRTFCQDKDECQIGAKKICGLHTSCLNTIGSYMCSCLSGYSPSNHNITFIPNDGTHCQDIDECQRVPGVCGEGARCVNLEGDFECHCLLGYRAHNAAEPFQPLRDTGSCKVVDCGRPPNVEDAVVLSTTGTTYGSVALLGCQDGWAWRRGDNSSTCGVDGTWSRPGMVCEEVDCGVPPTPPHAHVLQWNKTSGLGSEVLHHCNSGYHNVGGDTLSVCTPSGQWEVSMLCKEITCGRPPVVRSAEHVWNGDTAPGSSVLYSCIEGFYNSGGNGLMHCNQAGHWTKATISCQEISCGDPPVLPHTGRLWNGSSSPGTVVFYYCKLGFHEDKTDFNNSHDAANMSVCRIHGNWTGPNISCKAIDCGLPPEPPHAIALWGNGSTLGSVVVYQCARGYRNVEAGNTSVCSASGEWSWPRFSCQEIQCGEPLSKPHAKVLWDNATHIGSVLHYQCDEGYHASAATNSSVCGEDGQWEESDLQCEELRCGDPLALPHTRLLWDGRSAQGSVVLYVCADGYKEESGQQRGISECSQTGEWGSVSLNCRARCGPTPSLSQAAVVWYNASMAMHRCVDGYHSWRGSSVSVCGSTGEWQEATLKCIEVKPAISDLQVFNERCLRWRAEKYEDDKEVYTVAYRGTREYQGAFRHQKKQSLLSRDEWVDVCLRLLPATNYTVSITAVSTRFTASITTNTSVPVPQAPLISYREVDTSSVTLRLQRSAHTLDAISVYQVFVVPLDRTVVFDCTSTWSPDFSHAGPSSGQYVAGQFPLRLMMDTEMNFTVGDGRSHGGFFNAPLERGRNYYIILRVVSHWKEAFKCTCVLWAKVTGTSYLMEMSSLCAAGSIGVLLLVILLGYSCTRFFKEDTDVIPL